MKPTRVVLFCVDGMRPDTLSPERTPVIDRLRREGAYTGVARSIMPSITLPCFTSMLRGVDTARHGITTNTFHPLARPVPSLIDVAKAAGKRTGFFYNWEQLRDLSNPGSLDISLMYRPCHAPEDDRNLISSVVAHLEQNDFEFLMIYLGWTDAAGHRHGWMTPPYLDAVANADACLGTVLDAMKRLGRAEETVTLVTADHGGHERSHGTDMDEDMLVPWVLHGPGIRAGVTLEGPVHIYDTCPTLAHLLGAAASPEWEGQVVTEALRA